MSSIRITTDQAKIGMVSANNIYSKDSQLLINEGTKLSERSIIRLKLYGIKELEVLIHNDFATSDTEEVEEMQDQNSTDFESNYYESDYFGRLRNTKEFRKFKTTIVNSADYMKNYFNRIVQNKEHIDTKALLDEVEIILAESRNGIHLIEMLSCINSYDDSTYLHSINVSLICYAIGRWVNLPIDEIRVLALCGLLHDIGKLQIPYSILLKPSKLTNEEYKKIQEHTILGYRILEHENIDPRIKTAALMHHEKCDGSGYPSKLKSNQIDIFSKIVAIADVYDAMTSNRVYRGPICPFNVISEFEKDGLIKFDPLSLLTFLENMVNSYINYWVLLSNQEKAEIIMINKNALSKPVVRTQNENYIDLSREREIKIMAFI